MLNSADNNSFSDFVNELYSLFLKFLALGFLVKAHLHIP